MPKIGEMPSIEEIKNKYPRVQPERVSGSVVQKNAHSILRDVHKMEPVAGL